MRARDVMRRKRFRKGLKSKPSRLIVGSSSKFGLNPLENHLRENGYPNAVVGVRIWWSDYDSGVFYGLPNWAQQFISDVDLTELKRITAQRAIKLLEAA